MPKERLQILVEPEQKLALEQQSRATGMSIGMLIRNVLDDYLRETNIVARRMEREAAYDRLAARAAVVPEPDELRRLIDEK